MLMRFVFLVVAFVVGRCGGLVAPSSQVAGVARRASVMPIAEVFEAPKRRRVAGAVVKIAAAAALLQPLVARASEAATPHLGEKVAMALQ